MEPSNLSTHPTTTTTITTTSTSPSMPSQTTLPPSLKPRPALQTLLTTLTAIDSGTLSPSNRHHSAQTIINACRSLITEAQTIMGSAWVAMDAQTRSTFELSTEFDPRYPLLEPLPREDRGVLESEAEFPVLGESFENAWAARSAFFRGFEFLDGIGSGEEGEEEGRGKGKEGGGGRWKGEGGEAWMKERREGGMRMKKCKKREVVVEQKEARTEVLVKEWKNGVLVRDEKHVSDGKTWDHGDKGKVMKDEVDDVLYHKSDKNEGLRGSW